ncbi:MAG TPA: putative Ig domain-containing protein [Blastocatellia bacterium]|nr:putative Ig domain-containing protein [Blastocatellia bacterium]
MKNRFKGAWLKSLSLLILLLGASHTAEATTVTIPADDDLIIGARAIVRGRVISIESGLDEHGSRIFTYVTLRVQEVLKGQITARRIVIKEEGGQTPTRGSIIFGSPQFAVDEQVLLYLDTWPDGSFRVHQMFLGKFSIIADPQSGRDMVVRSRPGSNVAVVASQSQSAGGATTDRSELKAYLKMVRARLDANRERVIRFEVEHYSRVPMLAAPTEYEARRAGGEIQPQFTLISPSIPTRWFEPDNGEPVTFLINTEGAPIAGVIDDISAAMSVWSSVPGCTLRVASGGTTDECLSRGGGNVVVFNNCDGRFAPVPGCASIIALGGLSWDTSQTRVVNGMTFYKAILGFISFNPYSFCSFESNCNIREITTHELGHALGLGHSQHVDATMFGGAHFDGRCASIRQDDINGIRFLYPLQDPGATPLAITTGSQLPGAARSALYMQALEASGGILPYSWSLLAVEGRLPTGMTLTSGGIVGGTPLEEGTYNFTAQVRDAAGATAQKSFTLVVGTTTTLPYDSQFISQTVPSSVEPGQSFSANIKWLNRGTQVWNGAAGLKVRSQNPENNTTWGGNTVQVASAPVPAGGQLDITFSAIAPHAPGAYTFQWQLFQEGTGFFGQASTAVQVTVLQPQASSPQIDAPSSLAARKGEGFRHQLLATGGTPPYLWSMPSGSLPAGISLNPNTGMVSGNPIVAGAFSITIQVTDSALRATQKNITVAVSGPPPEVTTSVLPSSMTGVTFSFQLSANGGTPPYRWAVSAGSLPLGISLDRNNGILAGTPLVSGSFAFTVDLTDTESRTARRSLSLTVIARPLAIEFAEAVEVLKGAPFHFQANALGGAPPYTWSMASGSLPSGLALNTSTGTITGTPSASGTFSLTISVRDHSSQTASKGLSIRVIDPATIPSITKALYKTGKKKLTIQGERIDRNAQLLVDGRAVRVKFSGGSLVAKKLVLTAGRHEIVVVNPDNVSSQPFVLQVN